MGNKEKTHKYVFFHPREKARAHHIIGPRSRSEQGNAALDSNLLGANLPPTAGEGKTPSRQHCLSHDNATKAETTHQAKYIERKPATYAFERGSYRIVIKPPWCLNQSREDTELLKVQNRTQHVT